MKKQVSLWIAVFMLFGTLTMFAQKPFAGKIVFGMTAEGTDDPNVAAQLAEVSEEVIVMGNNTKTVAGQMGIDFINITNGDYKLVTTVIGITGIGKYYIEQEAADIENQLKNVKFDYNKKDETKQICGYNCNRVDVTMTNLETDEERTMVLWVTEELMTGENINFSTYPGLKGYPLRVDVQQEMNGETFTLVQCATSVTADKKIKASSFLRPSDAQHWENAPEDVKAGIKQLLGMSE